MNLFTILNSGQEHMIELNDSMLNEIMNFYLFQMNDNFSKNEINFFLEKRGYDISSKYSIQCAVDYYCYEFSSKRFRDIELIKVDNGYDLKIHPIDSVRRLDKFLKNISENR